MDLDLPEGIDQVVTPSNTRSMKFAISVPDELFAAVDARVEKMGISRSQFFADAASRYLDSLSRAAEIDEINDFVAQFGDNTTDPESSWILEAGRRTLRSAEWIDDESE
jgi:Predicted transcriptional regulators containing the CopG/Arc/MetJ DNA-binding domain and a metal-binding domain